MDDFRKPQSPQEHMFSLLFKDIDTQINALKELKSDLPASIAEDIRDVLDKSTDSIHQLLALVETVKPGFEKAIEAEAKNLAAQVGLLVKAAEGLNKKADDLIAAKTAKIDEIVKEKVESAIDQAFGSKIAVDLGNLNNELNKSSDKVKRIAAAAEISSRGNIKTWIASMVGAALAGAIIALAGGWFIASSPQTPFAIRVDTKSVAEIVLQVQDIMRRQQPPQR